MVERMMLQYKVWRKMALFHYLSHILNFRYVLLWLNEWCYNTRYEEKWLFSTTCPKFQVLGMFYYGWTNDVTIQCMKKNGFFHYLSQILNFRYVLLWLNEWCYNTRYEEKWLFSTTCPKFQILGMFYYGWTNDVTIQGMKKNGSFPLPVPNFNF